MASRTKKARGGAAARKGMSARRKAAGGAGAGNAQGRDLGEVARSIPALKERNGATSAVLKQVGMEVLRDDLEPAAWARALVEGSGTRDDTLSHYARIRVAVLTEQEEDRRSRKSEFEMRQKSSFQDVGAVPVVSPTIAVKRKVLGCVDAVFWHAIAMVAGVGTLVAASLLWPDLRLQLSWQFLAAAVVVMQLIPLVGWRVGRGGLMGVTYSQASQIAACLAMLGSVGVGSGLLMRHPPQSETMARPAAPRVEQRLLTGEEPGGVAAPEVSATVDPDEAVAVSAE